MPNLKREKKENTSEVTPQKRIEHLSKCALAYFQNVLHQLTYGKSEKLIIASASIDYQSDKILEIGSRSLLPKYLNSGPGNYAQEILGAAQSIENVAQQIAGCIRDNTPQHILFLDPPKEPPCLEYIAHDPATHVCSKLIYYADYLVDCFCFKFVINYLLIPTGENHG